MLMVDLVVSLSNERKMWNYVVKLINEHNWDKISLKYIEAISCA